MNLAILFIRNIYCHNRVFRGNQNIDLVHWHNYIIDVYNWQGETLLFVCFM